VFGSFIGFVLMFTGAAHAHSIFVDKNSTASYEDGSPGRRFGQSREALILRAKSGSALQRRTLSLPRQRSTYMWRRALRTPYVGSFDPAVFDPVSPSYDPSKERLPLLLNIPRLNLRGGTLLVEGEDSLPEFIVQGTGPYSAAT